MDNESSPICFICLDESDEENPLISPCACRGSAAWVHTCCLKEWHIDLGGSTNLICPTCKQQYVGDVAEELARLHLSQTRSKNVDLYEHAHVKLLEECWALDQLGHVVFGLGKYDESLELFKASLSHKIFVLGGERVNVANSFEDIGSVYRMRGQYELALEYKKKALKIRIRFLGPNHSDTMTSYNNIGLVLQNMGKNSDSMPYFKVAIASYEQECPNGSTSMACTLNNLAGSLRCQGDFVEAETLYRRSLAMRIRILGTEHPAVAESLNNLALVMMDIGNLEQAKELSSQCMTLVKKLFDDHQPVYLNYLGNYGMVLLATGTNEEECRDLIMRALEGLRENKFPDTHVWNQKFRKLLGDGHQLSPNDSTDGFCHPKQNFSRAGKVPRTLSLSYKGMLGLVSNIECIKA